MYKFVLVLFLLLDLIKSVGENGGKLHLNGKLKSKSKEEIEQYFDLIVKQCPNLKKLFLGNNQLDSLPIKICELTSLEELSLPFNKFTQFPLHITNVTSLKELDLSYNKLESIPSEISHLTSLEWLHLDNNQLHTLPASMCLLTNLERLFLQSNPLDPNRTPLKPKGYYDKASVQAALSLLEPKWLKWQYEGINIHIIN